LWNFIPNIFQRGEVPTCLGGDQGGRNPRAEGKFSWWEKNLNSYCLQGNASVGFGHTLGEAKETTVQRNEADRKARLHSQTGKRRGFSGGHSKRW